MEFKCLPTGFPDVFQMLNQMPGTVTHHSRLGGRQPVILSMCWGSNCKC